MMLEEESLAYTHRTPDIVQLGSGVWICGVPFSAREARALADSLAQTVATLHDAARAAESCQMRAPRISDYNSRALEAQARLAERRASRNNR